MRLLNILFVLTIALLPMFWLSAPEFEMIRSLFSDSFRPTIPQYYYLVGAIPAFVAGAVAVGLMLKPMLLARRETIQQELYGRISALESPNLKLALAEYLARLTSAIDARQSEIGVSLGESLSNLRFHIGNADYENAIRALTELEAETTKWSGLMRKHGVFVSGNVLMSALTNSLADKRSKEVAAAAADAKADAVKNAVAEKRSTPARAISEDNVALLESLASASGHYQDSLEEFDQGFDKEVKDAVEKLQKAIAKLKYDEIIEALAELLSFTIRAGESCVEKGFFEAACNLQMTIWKVLGRDVANMESNAASPVSLVERIAESGSKEDLVSDLASIRVGDIETTMAATS